ncbi:hypothetical protein [Lonsdalea britannica]|uniref:hypothetical protein n=1 Tax=Lonsdalea britannica TaxID=1082704 RepID=UPI0026EC99D9|nr:hypothetical protein [Lonsdalea britannica]
MEVKYGVRSIPSIEYCRVSRASEILGCSVEDIIYWAGEGKIKLCVKLYDAKGKILVPAIPDPKRLLLFFIEMMNVTNLKEFIHDGNEYVRGYPLIDIFPEKLFYPETEDQITDFANDIFQGDGFSVSVDGLWELESDLFSFYDVDNPPIIGGVSEKMTMAAKIFEALGVDLDESKISLMKNSSFKANPADSEDEIGDYVFMAGIQPQKITLSINNLFITKSQMSSIYENLLNNSIKNAMGLNSRPIKVTVKQSVFTVALLKELGIKDNELKGSITKLRQRISNLAPSAPVPDDDKSLIDWLRKGGVDR